MRTCQHAVFAGQGGTGLRACNADSVKEADAAGKFATLQSVYLGGQNVVNLAGGAIDGRGWVAIGETSAG